MTGSPDRTLRWVESPAHQQWLLRRLDGLLEFSQKSISADGGFHYLDGAGHPMPDHPPTLLLTARMTHSAAIGHVVGVPGASRLLDHGMRSLLGTFTDEDHGGWNSTIAGRSNKATYDHVHVALAASSSFVAGHRDAQQLLDQAIEVINTHLWQEDEGALAESFGNDWSNSEPYRGANANMHGVEAMLALGDVTADGQWHDRAIRVASRIINTHARARGWLIPEHFDADWRELPDYNIDHPNHPFRPYGATYGHSLEWARLLVSLHESPLVSPRPWLLEAAKGLAGRALDSWGHHGRDGLVYTVDWNARPVSTLRLHWPICEAIQACSALSQATGDAIWESWYRTLWDHANAYFIDSNGVWINEVDEHGREAGSVWPGRPDVYHSIGAYISPLVSPSPFITLAASRGLTLT